MLRQGEGWAVPKRLEDLLADLDDTRLVHVGDILSAEPWEGTARGALDWVGPYRDAVARLQGDEVQMQYLGTWVAEFKVTRR